MILLFYVTDASGTERCLSAVCGPSTTAAGAVNLFRSRVGVPNEVRVEVRLDNQIPIRHQTAPLTSLRKQRGGVVQVLQIQLWVTLSGPEAALAEVDLSKLEQVRDEDEGEAIEKGTRASRDAREEEVTLEEMGPSWTARGERRPLGPAPRIVKERSPSAVERVVVEAEEAQPQTARRPAPAMSVRIAMPAPMTARGVRRSEVALPPSRRTSAPPSVSVGERVTKSKPAAKEEEGPAAVAPPAAAAVVTVADAAPAKPRASVECRREEATAQAESLADRGRTVRCDCSLAQMLIREYPRLVDPGDAKLIAQSVREDDRLSGMAYDPALQVPSAIDGLSDADYSRYLSAGLVNGIEIRSATLGHRIALYGTVNTLRHSCWPNAAVHVDVHADPHAASCRCAVFEGLRKGDRITYLYRHADSQAFMLLSRERRQNLLKRRYFFDCTCPRCTAAGPATRGSRSVDGSANGTTAPPCVPPIPKATLEAEATLTGCFFTDSSIDTDPARQAAVSEEMRGDFDALQIMSDDGLEITLTVPGNVPPIVRTKHCNQLLQFMRKYGRAESVLRLHEHHWRLNMVRAAYIQETVRLCAVKGVTPEARRRDPENRKLFTPTRTVYDLCLRQLAVESLFIPAGHPHSLTTYESFQYLVSILPPSLAGAVVQQARATSRINWKQLQETKEVWGVLKRMSLPPSVSQPKAASAAGGGAAAAAATGPAAAAAGRTQSAVAARPKAASIFLDGDVAARTTVKRPITRAAVEVGERQ